MLTVGALPDAVQQLGHLEEPAIALEQPLSVCETGALNFAGQVDVRCQSRPLRQIASGKTSRRFRNIRVNRIRHR
jgi:hypothetical protein